MGENGGRTKELGVVRTWLLSDEDDEPSPMCLQTLSMEGNGFASFLCFLFLILMFIEISFLFFTNEMK